MAFDNLRFNLALRVVLIVSLSLALAFVLSLTSWFFTPIVLSSLIILSSLELIHHLDKTNRELSNFFLNIRQTEFTTSFSGKERGKSYRELFSSLEQLMAEFRKLNLQKESHYQYLQTLNENIGVAIISFRENGKVQFINHAAKQLLHKPILNHVEDLKSVEPKLYQIIKRLKPGNRELVPMELKGEWVHLSVHLRSFRLQDETFTLVLMQNLHHELEEKEVEAWQKLINVLTHEIMNSVTPIVSLVNAVNNILEANPNLQNALNNMDKDERSDFEDSLKTIETRSRGLLKFINAYRDYSTTPEFKPADFDFMETLKKVQNLMKQELEKNNVELIILALGLSKLKAFGDEQLIEQVIINLVRNSIYALKDTQNASISMSVKRIGDHKVHLTFSDNGPGISDELMERIFVPFYSTKKGGTGIGLSLSRQIMKLHNGSIKVGSGNGKGASFIVEF